MNTMSIDDRVKPWDQHPLAGELGAETMLSIDEVNYLHWLGKTRYTGTGRVVELGSFLGGSTLALCKGLAQNPAWQQPLLAYDRFIMFNDQENRYAHIAAPGESFLPVFQNNLRDYKDRITTRPMGIPDPIPGVDHTEALYPEREPIEILFVDAAKSWPVHLTILRVFGPHLIPGKSVVIQQDFKWATVYYLPLHMYQLRSCFEPAHDIPQASTTAFRYTGGIEDHLETLWTPEYFTADSARQTWDEIDEWWSEYQLPTLHRMLRLLRAQHMVTLGAHDEAAAIIQSSIRPAIQDTDKLFLYGVSYALHRLIGACSTSPQAVDVLTDCRAVIDQALPTIEHQVASRKLDEAIDSIASQFGDTGSARPTAILFGAGRFTHRLLSRGTADLPFKPLAIVDDHAPLDTIAGVPVVRPSDLAPHATADFVLISSDTHAEALEARARATLGDDISVVRVDRPAPTPQATP